MDDELALTNYIMFALNHELFTADLFVPVIGQGKKKPHVVR